jgi:hypothetical protein
MMTDLFKLSADWARPTIAVETTWYVIGLFVVVVVVLFGIKWCAAKNRMKKLQETLGTPESYEVTLNLQVVEIKGTWKPDESERKAAWELYTELITRISVAELRDDEGLLREALSSLHSLFDTTRKILRQYGPSVAKAKDKDDLSFGFIAVNVLNLVLRPVLAKWHPVLQHHESSRSPGTSPWQHEQAWDQHDELREELERVRLVLTDYAKVLAKVAGVPLPMKVHILRIDCRSCSGFGLHAGSRASAGCVFTGAMLVFHMIGICAGIRALTIVPRALTWSRGAFL